MTTIPQREDILAAHHRISPHVHKTAVLTNQTLDKMLGSRLFFKCENFQKAGAFKSRGAVNTVFSLSAAEAAKGVASHSSGNHAQALARAARLRGIPAYLVMPSNSSAVKVNAVRGYQGNITFCEPTLASREASLLTLITATAACEVHPYNDYRVIAGQATAALELFQEVPRLDYLLVPLGGGGLLSGSLLAARYFSPGTRVIGVEPEMANDAFQSFHNKRFIPANNSNTIADGLRTSLGSLTYPIIMEMVDDILTVSEESIIHSMKLVWERMKILIEPSSAVPLAAMLEEKFQARGIQVGILFSGGNVDLDQLPWINTKTADAKR